MDTEKLIATLENLIQADIDTVYVYKQIVEQISDDVILSQLTTFQEHHTKHIKNLSHEIELLGGRAPKFSRDLKGHLLGAITAFFNTADMKGAMMALKKMEEQTNEIYGSAVSLNCPSTLKASLRTFFSEEKTHLEYINENLKVL